MKKLILALMMLLLVAGTSCKKQEEKHILLPGEEVISAYPNGKIRETAFFEGSEPNRGKLKSFEFYITGQKKKEFNYRDNHYYGPWIYWYKNGKIMAEGIFDEKTLIPGEGTGRGIYYWPDGKKMIELDVRSTGKERTAHVTYYDGAGNVYTNENIPEKVKGKIRLTIQNWENGKI